MEPPFRQEGGFVIEQKKDNTLWCYPLVRSTGIEPACPGDTRSLVLRVCQFRHDRISFFSTFTFYYVCASFASIVFVFLKKFSLTAAPFRVRIPSIVCTSKQTPQGRLF